MTVTQRWRKEPGSRVQGSRPLDELKVQAPCVVRVPEGGYRMFYTAVGPAKPYATCQGYILSAFSSDGLQFNLEPGIRVAPQPAVPHMALRVLSPTVARCVDGGWRMYFESRGSADRPTVICSAVSDDLLYWKHEEGIRLAGFDGVGGPRYVVVPYGHGRVYCFASDMAGYRSRIFTAHSGDGLNWKRAACVIEGGGYNSEELDAVHSEDLSLVEIEDGQYRMYYAACDRNGIWRIASAVSRGPLCEPDV
jgi:hypothetical protein